MALNADLGTIKASVRLDLTQLKANISEGQGLLKGFASDVKAAVSGQVSGMNSEIKAQFGKTNSQISSQVKSLVGTLSNYSLAAGGAITSALGVALKTGDDWNAQLTHISANTKMTREQTEEMRRTVESLGSHMAAPLDRIADGYMHVSNFGFQAADATKILTQTTRAAVATGGDASRIAEVVAGTLHNFGMSADYASQTTALLQTAAARANSTLTEFADAAGAAFAKAHAYGVSLAETSAAIETLTQHQFSAPVGATLFEQAIAHIAVPTAQTEKAVKRLSKLTGIDLVRDFSQAGLRAKGFQGILEDLTKVANKLHVPVTDVINKVLRGALGGTGTAVLAQNLKEYSRNVKELNDVFAKGAAGIWQFAAANNSLGGQVQIVKSNLQILSREIEDALVPAIAPVLDGIHKAIDAFIALPLATKQAIVQFAAITGVGLLVAGTLGRIALGISGLVTGFTAAVPAITSAGTALLPFAGWIVGIGAAIALLVVAWQQDWGKIREHTQGFIDWAKPGLSKLWGGIVDDFKGAMAWMKDFSKRFWTEMIGDQLTFVGQSRQQGQKLVSDWKVAWEAIVAVVKTYWGYVKGVVRIGFDIVAGILTGGMALLQGHWKAGWDNIKHYLQDIWGSMTQIVSNGVLAMRDAIDSLNGHLVGAHARAYDILHPGHAGSDAARALGGAGKSGFNKPEAQPRIGGESTGGAGGLGDIGGGGGGHVGRAKKALNDLQQQAEATAQAIKDTMDSIFHLTHDDATNERMDALNKFTDRRQAGVPFSTALKELALTNLGVDKKLKEAADEMARKQSDSFKEFMQENVDYANSVSDKAMEILTKRAEKEKQIQDETREDTYKLIEKEVSEADNAAKMFMQMDEDVARNRFELNQKDYRSYLDVLSNKISLQKIYSDDWKKTYDQIGEIAKAGIEKQKTQTQELLSGWKPVFKKMSDQMTGVFEGAFSDLFKKGFGKFFQDVVKGFEQMLEQMLAELLAKAAIFGILSLVTGGSGSIGSFGKFLGFDDGGNDRKAVRWGFDFANLFTQGMQSFGNQRQPVSAGSNSRAAQSNTFHIQMTNHISNDMDIDHVADRLAWRVKTKMPGYIV